MPVGTPFHSRTAAEPTLSWLMRQSRRFDVTIEDSTDRIGTLSLQGPTSRNILNNVSDADLDSLRYFNLTKAKLGGVDVLISRTGYTGAPAWHVTTCNAGTTTAADSATTDSAADLAAAHTDTSSRRTGTAAAVAAV
jgi:aminomethyltransferase